MKRLLLSLLLAVAALLPAGAMSYEEARDRAWYLTDKMAYELNLTQEQYDRAYQINLDYLLSIQTASDCLGPYWTIATPTCAASCSTGSMSSSPRSTISSAPCDGSRRPGTSPSLRATASISSTFRGPRST